MGQRLGSPATTVFTQQERDTIDYLFEHRYGQRTCRECKERKLPTQFRNLSTDNQALCNDCRSDYGPDRHYQTEVGNDWQELSSCLDEPLDVFFPTGHDDRYKKICGDCPVKQQCAQRGAESHADGVWGGQLWKTTHTKRWAVDVGPRKAPGRPSKWTPEQKDEMVRLRAEGMLLADIAEKFGTRADYVSLIVLKRKRK